MSHLSNRERFLRYLAPTSPAPMGLEIDRAEGVFLYDPAGKAYLDLIAGIGVSSLGHRHPNVLNAVQTQLEKYWHTLVYGELVMAPQVKLAELLTSQLPNSLDSVYFVNSGSEATEGAMKLAKRVTGRIEIIAAYQAYHGSTQGAASLMNPTAFTQPFHPLLPGIRHLEFNEVSHLERITTKTAAVIVETVQGEWGLRPPDTSWIQALRARCSEVGALLILDEIQAGYGRTGHLFAFSAYDIVPDILLLGKGMGGGMPLAAFVASQAHMRTLSHDPVLGHITTFGGHPVCCAAGLATLEVLIESDLITQVPQKAARFRKGLQHPAIQELREAGLWFAIDLGNSSYVYAVIAEALKSGLITDWFLFNDRSLRIAPPLTIRMEEIDLACQILVDAIDKVYAE